MEQAKKIAIGIVNFLRASDKLEFLPEVIRFLEKEVVKIKGEGVAVVISAQPLNDRELTEIEKQLLYLFGRKLEIVNKIDPSLVGCFGVHVADKVIDLSLNNYLTLLEEKIIHENN